MPRPTAVTRLLSRMNAAGVVNREVVLQRRLIGTEYVVDTFTHDGQHAITDICRYRPARRGVRAAAGSWDSLVAAVMPAVEAALRRVDEGAQDSSTRWRTARQPRLTYEVRPVAIGIS